MMKTNVPTLEHPKPRTVKSAVARVKQRDHSAAGYEIPESPYSVQWQIGLRGSVISVSATANCSFIVAGTVNRCVTLMHSGGQVLWQKSLNHEVWATAISDDGCRIAVGTAAKNPAKGTIHIFDFDGGCVWRHELPAPIWSLDFSNNGDLLVAGCWDSNVYVFEADESQAFNSTGRRKLGISGVYGAAISGDGDVVLACSYDTGVFLLDSSLENIIHHARSFDGTYRCKLSRDGSLGVAGLCDGRFLDLRRDAAGVEENMRGPVSQRPMCGVDFTDDGKLIVLGSFDGQAYLTNRSGVPLWTYRTSGEVWSVATSGDGAIVCVASGDGTVHLIQNHVSSSAVTEIELLEASVRKRTAWHDREILVNALIGVYLRYGLIQYGVKRFEEWEHLHGADLTRQATTDLLSQDVAAHPSHAHSHLALARVLESQRCWQEAGQHYVLAASNANLKMQAMIKASESFSSAGMSSASMSCCRRASEQSMHDDDKRILYNLAGSYQDAGQFAEAKKHYEILLSWDPDYRDVQKRLARLDRGDWIDTTGDSVHPGLSASLLGPDVPKINEVDASLTPILNARKTELHLSSSERQRLDAALSWYREVHEQEHEEEAKTISYDTTAYLKYDYLPAEDGLKKKLELLNLIASIEGENGIRVSLDIGTATGRHPTVLNSRGIEAHGVDNNEDAIRYAIRKLGDREFPKLKVADARQLTYDDNSFDLVTCMMGTFAHIEPEDHSVVLAEISRCLRPGGILVISTWDIECRHLSFLSMYSHHQKELIRRCSRRRSEMKELLVSSGFGIIDMKPFAMLPDVFSYEMGMQNLGVDEVCRLIEVDLAARAAFPEMHGQMFMSIARYK